MRYGTLRALWAAHGGYCEPLVARTASRVCGAFSNGGTCCWSLEADADADFGAGTTDARPDARPAVADGAARDSQRYTDLAGVASLASAPACAHAARNPR